MAESSYRGETSGAIVRSEVALSKITVAPLLCADAQSAMDTHPEWNDLKVFLAVARLGTISDAGEKLGIEHSTVSRRIDRLEATLRVVLFDRRRSGYSLTDAGHALIPHAERWKARCSPLWKRAWRSRISSRECAWNAGGVRHSRLRLAWLSCAKSIPGCASS